jgi:tetratricopeptide (TPR) repeat protein
LLSSYLDQAEGLIAERQYSEAVNILEEAAQVHSDTPLPLLKIGQIYLLQHRWLPAEDAFNRALARDLANPAATAGLAETKLNQGQLRQALALWQQAGERNPDLPGVLTGVGRAYLLLFEFEAAEAAFLAQQKHRSDPEAQWHLAALAAPRDLEAANKYLLAIPPDAPDELLARRDYLLATLAPFTAESDQVDVAQAVGVAFIQISHWPLAAHALAIAGDFPGRPNAERAETLAFLGHALAQAGRPAFDLFEEATRLDPDSALPAYFYGIYFRRKGALDAAENLFTQALTLDPKNAAIYIELAQTRVDRGDLATAEKLYTAAAELAQDEPEIQLLRVQFYAGRGYRLAEAGIPAAEALIEADEENAKAYDLLGWMQFLSGDSAEAEIALRKAIELDPNLISARYHLARYLDAMGKTQEAIVEYRKVIDWDTTNLYRPHAARDVQRLQEELP